MKTIVRLIVSFFIVCMVSWPCYSLDKRDAVAFVKPQLIALHEASPHELKLIKKYFIDEYRKENELLPIDARLTPTFMITTVDVNDAGAVVYLVVVQSSLYCGSIGCALTLWMQRRGRWCVIGHALYNEKANKQLHKKTNGFYDLVIGGIPMVWNGTSYDILSSVR